MQLIVGVLITLPMDKSVLRRHLEEVLQTIVVIKDMCCVEQKVEHVSQMEHGLDHHQSV